MYDFLVVGAGLAGCTMAECLASQLDASVLIIDKRGHIAGNAYDGCEDGMLRYHRYGPHIFHTNADHVVRYLSCFTQWRPYEHRVSANVQGKLVPIPINRTTLNRLYDLALDEAGARAFLASRADPLPCVRNSADAIISKVGEELYELFFRGYTRKRWGIDPSKLDAAVCGRIPVRVSEDDRYFSDAFQCMPLNGFYSMCRNMLAHPKIEVITNASFRDVSADVPFKHLIYTGPIDEYYGYRFGKLSYRSVRFTFETHNVERYQEVACVNEPDESVPYTRTIEYKHLTGQRHPQTIIAREYACSDGESYYPTPSPANRERYARYAALRERERNVTFVGRLAEYRYYTMDQVVASALEAFKKIAQNRRSFKRTA